MNNISLIGRIANDVELKYTKNNISICDFTIAVDRKIKKDGQKNTDFLRCKAIAKTAEFMKQYIEKGQQIGLTGNIRTSEWEDAEGNKRNSTFILAESLYFAESRKKM